MKVAEKKYEANPSDIAAAADLKTLQSATHTGPSLKETEENLKHSIENKHKVFNSLLASGDINEDTTKMFQAAFTKLQDPNCQIKDKAGIKSLFPSIDIGTFEHVYSLFDWTSTTKEVDPREFVLTLSLLAIPTKDVEMEAVLIFTIFDPDGSGTLDREEFSSLMKATIMSKLTHVEFIMNNDAGGKVFAKHMAAEYTEENVAFYYSVIEWRKKETPTVEETQALIDLHIKAGSELEVNIPQTQQKKLLARFKECVDQNLPIDKQLFDEAHDEIYRLMDKDSYARFKKNPAEVKELTDALFDQADVNGDGVIELSEYQEWVADNPEAMNFIRELHEESQTAVKKVRESQYIHRLSVAPAALSPEQIAAMRKKMINTPNSGNRKLSEEDEEDESSEEEAGHPPAAPAGGALFERPISPTNL